MNKVIEEKVIPDMSPRLILLPSRTIHHCQLCGTWCNEVYNQTYGIWEYHCYHHGIVAEVHKPEVKPGPELRGRLHNLDIHMVEAECSVCGELFMRRKQSSRSLCQKHYYQFYTERRRKELREAEHADL